MSIGLAIVIFLCGVSRGARLGDVPTFPETTVSDGYCKICDGMYSLHGGHAHPLGPPPGVDLGGSAEPVAPPPYPGQVAADAAILSRALNARLALQRIITVHDRPAERAAKQAIATIQELEAELSKLWVRAPIQTPEDQAAHDAWRDVALRARAPQGDPPPEPSGEAVGLAVRRLRARHDGVNACEDQNDVCAACTLDALRIAYAVDGVRVPAPQGDAAPLDRHCGERAEAFIPRLGMSWACVLPKGHKGEHRRGGMCFAHGEYVGAQCPQWPSCGGGASSSGSAGSPPQDPPARPCESTQGVDVGPVVPAPWQVEQVGESWREVYDLAHKAVAAWLMSEHATPGLSDKLQALSVALMKLDQRRLATFAPLDGDSFTWKARAELAEAEVARLRGAAPAPPPPDTHPEAFCQQCRRRNVVWFAPSDIWNATMGGGQGILCPVCFIEAAERAGLFGPWIVAPGYSVQKRGPSAPTPEGSPEPVLSPREIVETRDLAEQDYASGHLTIFWRERVLAMLARIERPHGARGVGSPQPAPGDEQLLEAFVAGCNAENELNEAELSPQTVRKGVAAAMRASLRGASPQPPVSGLAPTAASGIPLGMSSSPAHFDEAMHNAIMGYAAGLHVRPDIAAFRAEWDRINKKNTHITSGVRDLVECLLAALESMACERDAAIDAAQRNALEEFKYRRLLEARTADLRAAIAYLVTLRDDGPDYEGWQSEDLQALIARLQAPVPTGESGAEEAGGKPCG